MAITSPNLPPLGNDRMDQYSEPLDIIETKLATKFVMPIRDVPDKPGRTLRIVWDLRRPLVDGFVNNYSYLVGFAGRGHLAGNHYHKEKHELFYPVIGNFAIILEDIQTQEREAFKLMTDERTFVYVRPGIAHTVVADSPECTLLVTASYPDTDADMFEYQLVEPKV